MPEDNNNRTPASPEVQPSSVRAELDQEDISHQGEPLKPGQDKSDPQKYMGALEDNVTPVMPPVTGPSDLTGDHEASDSSPAVNPRTELTPG